MITRRVTVAVGCAVVAVLAIGVVHRSHRGTAPSTASVPDRASLPPRGVRAPDPRTQPYASIAGTVHDEAGKPIAAARVCADATQLHDLEPACATSDAEGRFAIAELLATTYEVAASAPTFRIATYHPDGDRHADELVLHAGEVRTGVDLVLRGGGVELTGTVADVTGGPIPRAQVRVGTEVHDVNRAGRWGPAVIADDRGAFSIWVAPGDVRVRANASGYAPGELDATAPDRIAIVLTPESSIDGAVIDEAGHPVEGAEVVADAVDVHEHGRSDDRGHFHIDHLVPTRYAVSARTVDGYGRTAGSVRVGLASNVSSIVITLHAAYRVTGRVMLGDRPCAHPSVELHDVGHDRELALSADDDGWMHGDGIPRGRYAVHPHCAGGHPTSIAAIDLDRDRVGLTWSLVSGATIRGHVRTNAGTPVEGAKVEAIAADQLAAGDSDTTTRDGGYELRGLSATTYAITATAPHGAKRAERAVTGTETATLDFALDDGATIRGVVVDRAGNGLSHVSVSASGDAAPGAATTRIDGTFEIALAQPGVFDVEATSGPFTTRDGLHPKEHVIVEAGDVATVRLVVDSTVARIAGTVTDADATPVADAYVAAYPAGGAGTLFWSFTDHHPAITDQDGRFAIAGLTAASTYTVHAYRKGGGETFASSVAPTADVRLVLPRTASIAGTVRYDDGAAPEVIDLQLRDREHGTFRHETFDHTGGVFSVDDLPPGSYTISAATPDGFGVIDATLATGTQTTGVAIELDRMVPVTGRLVDDTGAPIVGIAVVAKSVRGKRGTITTPDDPNLSGSDGGFTTLAPRGEDSFVVVGIVRNWCAAAITKTITGPATLGDITLARCK